MMNLKYLNDELMDRTDKKTLYNALNNDNFFVVVSDNVWWVEKHSFMSIGEKMYQTLKKEMRRLYPDLTFLYFEHELADR